MFTRFVIFSAFSFLLTSPLCSSDSAQDTPLFLDIKTPMPGCIIKISVKSGDKVKKGQEIFIVEAMKMQCFICAEQDGDIGDIHYTVGDSVQSGHSIITAPVIPLQQPVLVMAPKMAHIPQPIIPQQAAVIASMVIQNPLSDTFPIMDDINSSNRPTPSQPLSISATEDTQSHSRSLDHNDEGIETVSRLTPFTHHREKFLLQEAAEMTEAQSTPDATETPLVLIASHNPPPSGPDEKIKFMESDNTVAPRAHKVYQHIYGKILTPYSDPITANDWSTNVTKVMNLILPTPVVRALMCWIGETQQIIHAMEHLAAEDIEQWVITHHAPKVMAANIQSHFPISQREWGRFFENLLGLTL
ncbi:MAG: acetyl-CoA carboxylase biotin carboxyl carrier protein subunit, partial [Alphaproteobacteria bacterium]|nr:acetyl-CoA carboxylase biotin carboxyl carrier protein subunit [Alphaproteobacteria bacterium]